MSEQHTNYAPGFLPVPARVEPPADCAHARAGGHSAPGAAATAAPGVLSRRGGNPRPFDPDVRRLVEEGKTRPAISAALGITLSQVDMAMLRMDLRCIRIERFTPDDDKKLLDMKMAGKSWREIANAIGRTTQQAENRWDRLRVMRREIAPETVGVSSKAGARREQPTRAAPQAGAWANMSTQDRIDDVRARRKGGQSLNDIAISLGTTRDSLKGFCRRHQIPVTFIMSTVNKRLTVAQQAHIDEQRKKITTYFRSVGPQLPPVSEAEAARLIAEAIAAGRVTKCPPMCAAPVNNGTGL